MKTVPFADVLAGKVPAGRVPRQGGRGRRDRPDPSGRARHLRGRRTCPGPEIHANAIATILRGFPLSDSAGWLSVLLIVLAGLVMPAARCA